MRVAFFLVNFGVAVLLEGVSIVAIVRAASTPEHRAFAVLGGSFVVLAFAWWMLAEWQGFFRDRLDLERQAGLCCLFLGAILLFASVSTGLNGRPEGAAPGVFWGSTAALFVAAVWFVTCGILRKRRTDSMDAGEEDTPGNEIR